MLSYVSHPLDAPFAPKASCHPQAEAAQVSRQRIIEIELGTDYTTEYQRQLVAKAFRSVIEKRGLDGCSLEKNFEKLESRLLEYAKDGEELL